MQIHKHRQSHDLIYADQNITSSKYFHRTAEEHHELNTRENISHHSQPDAYVMTQNVTGPSKRQRASLISTCITVLHERSFHDYGFTLDLQLAGTWQPGKEECNQWLFNPIYSPHLCIDRTVIRSQTTLQKWWPFCPPQQLNLKGSLWQQAVRIYPFHQD